jgi:hypothetical protein
MRTLWPYDANGRAQMVECLRDPDTKRAATGLAVEIKPLPASMRGRVRSEWSHENPCTLWRFQIRCRFCTPHSYAYLARNNVDMMSSIQYLLVLLIGGQVSTQKNDEAQPPTAKLTDGVTLRRLVGVWPPPLT